jgi:hypothetical protein
MGKSSSRSGQADKQRGEDEMTNTVGFAFPVEVQREREALQQTLRAAVHCGDLTTIKAAQEELCLWLQAHPDDYGMWDAGEPLALLADALEAETRQKLPAHAS